jgi:hypothetical protein
MLRVAADNSQKIGADDGLGAVLNDRACRRGPQRRSAVFFFMLFKKTPRADL